MEKRRRRVRGEGSLGGKEEKGVLKKKKERASLRREEKGMTIWLKGKEEKEEGVSEGNKGRGSLRG